jgi:hypothetical protein
VGFTKNGMISGHRRGGDSGHHRRKGQHAFTRGQPIIKGKHVK